MLRISVLCIGFGMLSAGSSLAAQPITEVPGYYDNALKHYRKGEFSSRSPITRADLDKHLADKERGRRCTRLNNYGCLKEANKPWNGKVGLDVDKHTGFSSPALGLRALAKNFKKAYMDHQRHSAWDIARVYTPEDDCIGSKVARLPDGRCSQGKNDTWNYANQLAKGIANTINEDLKLFDATGKPTPNLSRFLQNMMHNEVGHFVSDELLAEALALLEAQPD